MLRPRLLRDREVLRLEIVSARLDHRLSDAAAGGNCLDRRVLDELIDQASALFVFSFGNNRSRGALNPQCRIAGENASYVALDRTIFETAFIEQAPRSEQRAFHRVDIHYHIGDQTQRRK